MADDDDITTLGEYFEPIPFMPPVASVASSPSPELVRLLTSDIRTATRARALNTPALAEALVAKGWRPAELGAAPRGRGCPRCGQGFIGANVTVRSGTCRCGTPVADFTPKHGHPNHASHLHLSGRSSVRVGHDLVAGDDRDELDGATDVGDPAAYPSSPGEFAARWNARTPDERAEWLRVIVRALESLAGRPSTPAVSATDRAPIVHTGDVEAENAVAALVIEHSRHLVPLSDRYRIASDTVRWFREHRASSTPTASDAEVDAAADQLVAMLFPNARPNQGQTRWESTSAEVKDLTRRLVLVVAARLAGDGVGRTITTPAQLDVLRREVSTLVAMNGEGPVIVWMGDDQAWHSIRALTEDDWAGGKRALAQSGDIDLDDDAGDLLPLTLLWHDGAPTVDEQLAVLGMSRG